jgi:hypothetical protein
MSKIAFITAIFGNYELSCKPFAKQTIETAFICFTDNKNIVSNGWSIDTYPYHINNPSLLDNPSLNNSLSNNKHTFNIAKYYKQAFQNIPGLKDFDVIIWIDGTIGIHNPNTSQYILNKIYEKKIIGWSHEYDEGLLRNEVNASNANGRYATTFWMNQSQPFQDIPKQFETYLQDGFDENTFKYCQSPDKNFGVWITCFIAFLNKDTEVTRFLDLWYLQTLIFTTQDQVSFPYVAAKTGIWPYTLPNNEINGLPHNQTDFYIKYEHHK